MRRRRLLASRRNGRAYQPHRDRSRLFRSRRLCFGWGVRTVCVCGARCGWQHDGHPRVSAAGVDQRAARRGRHLRTMVPNRHLFLLLLFRPLLVLLLLLLRLLLLLCSTRIGLSWMNSFVHINVRGPPGRGQGGWACRAAPSRLRSAPAPDIQPPKVSAVKQRGSWLRLGTNGLRVRCGLRLLRSAAGALIDQDRPLVVLGRRAPAVGGACHRTFVEII